MIRARGIRSALVDRGMSALHSIMRFSMRGGASTGACHQLAQRKLHGAEWNILPLVGRVGTECRVGDPLGVAKAESITPPAAALRPIKGR